MNKTELLILVIIREMVNDRQWVTPSLIHSYLNQCGVNKATPPADPMDESFCIEFEDLYNKTLRTIARLVANGYLFETVTHEYGQRWECLRLTKVGFSKTRGYAVPKEIRPHFEPIVLPRVPVRKKASGKQSGFSRSAGRIN